MTAWQIASVPFWISGFCFSFVAFMIALSPVKNPARRKDKYAECGIAFGFGVPFLIIAPWMWTP